MGLNTSQPSGGTTPKASTPKTNLKEFLQKQKPPDSRPKSMQEKKKPKLKIALDSYLSKLGNMKDEDDNDRPNS